MTTVSLAEDRHADAVSSLEGVDVVEWTMEGPPPCPIDMVVLPHRGARDRLGRLGEVEGLQLVQGQSIGFDPLEGRFPPGIVFANAASVHETATAELALLLVLAAQRELASFVRSADRGAWEAVESPGLADARVLVVGAGGVGNAVVERLLPFEVTVDRVARGARTDDLGSVRAMQELPGLLAGADIVILAVPLTAETRGLADDRFLGAMKDGALLVNIARGPVVDTGAMRVEAASGRLRFALDVTDPEPLPGGDPLLTTPGVLITPHVGGATRALAPRLAALLTDQARRIRDGEPPRNVVIRT